MRYLPNTAQNQRAMLETIGARGIEDLLTKIPATARLSRPLALPPALAETELVRHLLDATVASKTKGRLIIGAHSEVAGSRPQLQAEVAGWGFRIAGAVEVPHAQDDRVVRRAFWVDRSAP